MGRPHDDSRHARSGAGVIPAKGLGGRVRPAVFGNHDAALGLEDLELLATAAYLVGKDNDSADVWARAHHECLRRGDGVRAARCAFWLAKCDHAAGRTLVADSYLEGLRFGSTLPSRMTKPSREGRTPPGRSSRPAARTFRPHGCRPETPPSVEFSAAGRLRDAENPPLVEFLVKGMGVLLWLPPTPGMGGAG